MRWIRRLRPGMGPMPACLRENAPWRGVELLVLLMNELGDRFAAPAAGRLRALMAVTPVADWPRLDERLRQRLRWWEHGAVLPWLRWPKDVRSLAVPPGTEAVVFGLLASVPDGYVRQAAVERLARVRDGDELAPLLVRANDWVPNVREAALDALRARVQPAYARAWIRVLGLVLRLRETGRSDAGSFVDDVLALLHRDDLREAVVEGLYVPDRAAVRACFRILARPGAADLADVVFRALGSDDVGLRLAAARVAARLHEAALRPLLPRMSADPFVRVRMVALELTVERMGLADVWSRLIAALLDRSAAVRAHARAIIARGAPMDVPAFYRGEIASDGPRLAAAVAGLGETGSAEDADVIHPLLSHARPRVQAAAIRALARLAGDASVPVFAAAVGSVHPCVSHAASDALRGRVHRADGTVLASWMNAENPPHVRRNALGLLAWRGKWDGIAWILQALTDEAPAIRASAAGHLARWRQRFNRTFSQPTAAQRERIGGALRAAAPALEPEMARWLRFAAGIA